MPETFRDLIAANKRNSVILVIAFVLFTTLVVMVLTLAILFMFDDTLLARIHWGRAVALGGLAAATALAIALLLYYEGGPMVLAVSGARPLKKEQDPQLYNVVEEMAIAAGVPMPEVYLILDGAPNAFATGRDPQHAVVAITSGLRTKLNREELQGVIAHEMAHIRNYDIRLMLLLAVLIGTIVMLSDVFWQMLRFAPSSGGGRSSSRDDKGKGGGAGAIMLVIFILAMVLALIAPLLAQIIQLAVSRQREYLADASAVELTRNPLGLAGALRKIADDPEDLKRATGGTAHLFIANPVKKFSARANSMLCSHPPIEDRIARLEALARA